MDGLVNDLKQYCERLQSYHQVWVALSGGADSCALLHALASAYRQLRQPSFTLHAIHIHHGLQAQADNWVVQVRQLCNTCAVPLTVSRVTVVSHGTGLEAAARSARYRAFRAALPDGAALLTAHHQDDQAETVLLNLLRGAGLRGLAAMPAQRSLGTKVLLRPLLGWSGEQLQNYCRQQGLVPIADPSNDQLQYRRNWLRHQLMPQLRELWPDAGAQMARSAAHLRDCEDWLEADEQHWWARHQTSWQQLDGRQLSAEPRFRQRRLVHFWLRRCGAPAVPARRLETFLQQLSTAAMDRHPSLSWQGWRLCRYGPEVHLLSAAFLQQRQPPPLLWPCHRQVSMQHPWWGELRFVANADNVPLPPPCALRIAFRKGGERLALPRRGRQTVKAILQQHRLPPWLRQRVPLVYHGETLWAVGDLQLHAEMTDYLAGNRLTIRWTPPPTVVLAPGATDGAGDD